MIKYEDISIRLMKDCTEDYSAMAKWLSDPNVLDYYEDRNNPLDFDKVVAKFKPRVLKESNVIPCFIQHDNNDIGYIQYYEIPEKDKEGYGYQAEELIYGIDLFIGETNYWNKGIGTKILKALLEYLKNEKCANRVIIDPQTWNGRAVRCYEKCGFVKVKLLPTNELHDGECKDNWLMEIRFK